MFSFGAMEKKLSAQTIKFSTRIPRCTYGEERGKGKHALSSRQEVVKFSGRFSLNEATINLYQTCLQAALLKGSETRGEQGLMFRFCFGTDPYIHNKSLLLICIRDNGPLSGDAVAGILVEP